MTQITEAVPVVGDPNSTFDPATKALLDSLVAKWNGNIDKDNLLPAEAARLGLSQTGTLKRQTATVATTQTTTSASYANLSTVRPEFTLTLEPLYPCLLIADVGMRISGGAGNADVGYHINDALPTYPWHGPSFYAFTDGTSGSTFPHEAALLGRTTSGTVKTLHAILPVCPSLLAGESTTYKFTIKYKVSGGATAEFSNRTLSVVSFGI